MNRVRLPMLFTLGGFLVVPSAFAQEGSPTSDTRILEEITVTAEKREQSLGDVPISIAVLGEEKLEQIGIDEIEDLGSNIPNLYVNPFNSDANAVRVFIRGIGQASVEVTQDPSVALYIDGVYAGTSFGLGFENADIERIEVLRGPQGTLYGRNATGGAVNIITTRPTLGEWGLKQTLSSGNLDHLKSRTQLNAPLADLAAIKLTYLKSERKDGLVENTGLGANWGVQDRDAYRVDLRIQPTDSLTLDYAYDRSNSEDTDNFGQIKLGSSLQTPAAGPIDLGSIIPSLPTGIYFAVPTLVVDVTQPAQQARLKRFAASRTVETNPLEVEGHSLTLAWEANDNLIVKSISAVRKTYTSSFNEGIPGVDSGIAIQLLQDMPFLGLLKGNFISEPTLGAFSQLRRDTRFEQFSQEIQLIGDISWGNSQIDYVAGTYYYQDEADQRIDQAVSAGAPRLPGDRTLTANNSLAIYGQATLTPGGDDGRWHFTLGARYTKDDREAFRTNPNSESFAASAPNGANYNAAFTNFNPSLTVAYDFNEQANVYAKVLTGFRSGGTSAKSSIASLFGRGVDEEKVTSYELGYKGLLLDSRLELNLALFQMYIDGFQASIQTGGSSADRDLFGLDGTESKGIEFDARALVTENLTFSIGLGLLDTEPGVNSVTVPALTPGGPDTVRAISTDALSYAPETSATVSLDYKRDIGNQLLTGYLGYNYQDEKNVSTNVEDQIVLNSYSLLNASLALSAIPLGAGKLSISLWGRNLTDKEYVLVSTNFVLIPEVSIFGDPRTYGLNFTYEY